MIATKKSEHGELSFKDNSKELVEECGQPVLDLVQAAMRAGLDEFTTPTLDDNEYRIDWKVRRWLTMRDKKLTCFLVAYKELNAHFEVLGPEVDLGGSKK